MNEDDLTLYFTRCEMDQVVELQLSSDKLDQLVKLLEYATKQKINLKEICYDPWIGHDPSRHRLRAVIRSVFTVQGLEWTEGTDVIPALESLVAKYAELK